MGLRKKVKKAFNKLEKGSSSASAGATTETGGPRVLTNAEAPKFKPPAPVKSLGIEVLSPGESPIVE